MTPKDLYSKWLEKFVSNGIPFEMDCDIIKFDSYKVYTPLTYKFTFNMGLSDSDKIFTYKFNQKNYKLFADLFFIKGWEEELRNSQGDVKYCVKPWLDYVTFQGYRTIVQFRYDKYEKYERKEKLKKISKL